MRVEKPVIVTNYLVYKFYKNKLHEKDLEIDINGKTKFKVDNKTIFNLNLFVIYIRLQYSIELTKIYVDPDEVDVLPDDYKYAKELNKIKLFVNDIHFKYKIDGKKASIDFHFDNYNIFRYYYDRSSRKLDLIYYKKDVDDDGVIVASYELPAFRNNVILICHNSKKYKRISYKFAKRIFDYIRDMKAFCNVLDLPDDITIGIYYDVERDDFASIYLPYVDDK